MHLPLQITIMQDEIEKLKEKISMLTGMLERVATEISNIKSENLVYRDMINGLERRVKILENATTIFGNL